jgi:alpha-D-ribose 1-methylphosphonate 5-triphosphate synthase subunit PhnH
MRWPGPAPFITSPDVTARRRRWVLSAGAVISTLADADTPVWLDPSMAKTGVQSRLGGVSYRCACHILSVRGGFALVAAPQSLSSLNGFALGTQDYPDRSTTLILQVETLSKGVKLVLEGPGIDGRTSIAPDPDATAFCCAMAAPTVPLFRAVWT